MPEDSDVNPFEEELKEDSYTGNLETNVTEAQIDAEHWYHDPEEWWRDSSNYQRQAMLVGAGITDMNLASFEYYDLSEDIQRQLAEDSITYSPESKASNTCPNCGSSDVGDGEDYGYKKDGEFPHLAGSSYQCNK